MTLKIEITPEDEQLEEEVHNSLLEAGLVSHPRPTGLSPKDFSKFRPVLIPGKPVSETVIEERR
jgi:hypothetical protein